MLHTVPHGVLDTVLTQTLNSWDPTLDAHGTFVRAATATSPTAILIPTLARTPLTQTATPSHHLILSNLMYTSPRSHTTHSSAFRYSNHGIDGDELLEVECSMYYVVSEYWSKSLKVVFTLFHACWLCNSPVVGLGMEGGIYST
jgi:hypothetical protein